MELGAGQIDIMHRQHRGHFQLVRAVLHKIVQPVIVGAADRRRELRIHIVARHERQADRREQDGDVDALHRHAHDLRPGVVAALDREHHGRVGALRHKRAADAVVLRDVAVIAEGLTVEIPGRPAAHAGGAAPHPPQRRGDARLEFRVEIFVEQIRRLHDVHVAIDKPVALFHPTPYPPLGSRRADPRDDLATGRPLRISVNVRIAIDRARCILARAELSEILM
jgi:hypothetical protein